MERLFSMFYILDPFTDDPCICVRQWITDIIDVSSQFRSICACHIFNDPQFKSGIDESLIFKPEDVIFCNGKQKDSSFSLHHLRHLLSVFCLVTNTVTLLFYLIFTTYCLSVSRSRAMAAPRSTVSLLTIWFLPYTFRLQWS